jgi:hypothetical protein
MMDIGLSESENRRPQKWMIDHHFPSSSQSQLAIYIHLGGILKPFSDTVAGHRCDVLGALGARSRCDAAIRG